ncbi:MAG: 50S ribosomal protein L25 [Candidatus Paceibacterota bacterium]
MNLNLKTEKREVFGKNLRQDREAGKMPVVLYGTKDKVVSLFVDSREFAKALKEAGESSVITLKTDGGDKDVLIHDVQFDPVAGQPIHADFYAVDKDKKVEVDIPLVFTGESPAIRELGAILIKVMHELPVEALPRDLPHEITVDISNLKTLDDQIKIEDISLPAGVVALGEADEVVVLLEEAREEVEEETPAPDLSTIEVEKKGKAEETDETETKA